MSWPAWQTGKPPSRGSYLVVDTWGLAVGQWTPEQGWCVRGRWIGHEVESWMELPPLPPCAEAWHAPAGR